MELEGRTFGNVHNFDAPCLTPCRKDTLLVIVGPFDGDNVFERGELGRKGQKEGNVLWGGKDD